MKDDFHVDMSGRIYKNRTIGIAIVGAETKAHFGCALKGNLVKLIKKRLFKEDILKDSAKLYAVCIYLLIKEVKEDVKTLIICNDEDFEFVKKVVSNLLKSYDFEIINISEFRKRLGRNIGSLADNYARTYRKRALKPTRSSKGRKLNIVPVTFNVIKQYWEVIKN